MPKQTIYLDQEHTDRQDLQQVFCAPGVLERPRYYPRQLMTPDDLTLEQNYFRDKLRRHNRLLHGWGVVCGAIVCRTALPKSNGKNGGRAAREAQNLPCPEVDDPSCLDPWIVSVSPGYILGPYGDEILIDCPVLVDVRKACTTVSTGDLCPPSPDPWCSDITVERRPGAVYLAVRYKEILMRPVRMQPAGCGCDEAGACEYTRIRDGYEICTLDRPPESCEAVPPQRLDCHLGACIPCPDEPWVVLARIELAAGGIRSVDNYSCRRMVVSYAGMWCRPEDPREKDKEDQLDREKREKALQEARALIQRHVSVPQAELRTAEGVLRVLDRQAVDLQGIKAASPLGKRLEADRMTIGGIAAMPQEKFVELALKDAPAGQVANLRQRADEAWKKAREVAEAVKVFEPRVE